MAAFLCETVLQEANGTLSFVRVVDRFFRARPTAQIQPQPIQVTLVTGFKGGNVPTGSYKLKLRVFKPDASAPFIEMENDTFFQGPPDTGVTVGTPLLLGADEEGLYWIDVIFVDRMITRVPFRVIFVAAPSIQTPPKPGA
jgi:hypothetical protein